MLKLCVDDLGHRTLDFFLRSFGLILSSVYSFLHSPQSSLIQPVLVISIVLSHCYWHINIGKNKKKMLNSTILDIFEFAFIAFLLPEAISHQLLFLGALILPSWILIRSNGAWGSIMIFIASLWVTSYVKYKLSLFDAQIGFSCVFILLILFGKLKSENKQKIDAEKNKGQPILLDSEKKNIKETNAEEINIIGLSHDARNLLNTLHSSLDSLSEENLILKKSVFYHSAVASAEILTDLLNHLLRTLLKDPKYHKSDFKTDLVFMLEQAWKVISPGLQAKHLKGSFKIEEGTPLYLESREASIRQILLNLLGNSIKFTDRGAITVRVSWIPDTTGQNFGTSSVESSPPERGALRIHLTNSDNSPPPDEEPSASVVRSVRLSPNVFRKPLIIGEINFNRPKFEIKPDLILKETQASQMGRLVINIVDTGCGIDKSYIGKLFQKREQFHPESSKRDLGFGLGLWYTKSLIEHLDGTITMSSHLGIGTETVIMIPCKVSKKGILKNDLFDIPPKILILQKSGSSRETFARCLDKKGFDVTIAKCDDYNIERLSKEGDYYDAFVVPSESLTNNPERIDKISEKLICVCDQNMSFIPFLQIRRHLKFQLQANDVEKLQEILYQIPKTSSFLKDKQTHLTKLVLVVDDDPFCLSFLASHITRAGFSCLTGRNGKEAYEHFEKNMNNISLVITDTNMPKMGGLELCQKIKAKRPELRVTAITGYNDDEFMAQAKQMAIDKVHVKPISILTLREELSKIIQIDQSIRYYI